MITEIVAKLGLSKEGRELLHNLIHGRGLNYHQIKEEAKLVKELGGKYLLTGSKAARRAAKGGGAFLRGGKKWGRYGKGFGRIGGALVLTLILELTFPDAAHAAEVTADQIVAQKARSLLYRRRKGCCWLTIQRSSLVFEVSDGPEWNWDMFRWARRHQWSPQKPVTLLSYGPLLLTHAECDSMAYKIESAFNKAGIPTTYLDDSRVKRSGSREKGISHNYSFRAKFVPLQRN